MRISRVDIKHFRSIKKIDLELSDASVLAGVNSCGKSNVLRAIRFAFLEEYSADRVASNFTLGTGPAAELSVRVYFDQPEPDLANRLQLSAGQAFTYEVKSTKKGKPRFFLNGQPLSLQGREVLLQAVLIVFVPPIRDISVGGLDPLKGLLAKALKNARKGQSLGSLNGGVRKALEKKGAEVLDRVSSNFGSFASLGKVGVDASNVDVSIAVQQLGVSVDLVGTGKVPLSALGTGHQSQVVMNLFGSLGASFPGLVVYMFEEPDNHLHPTALLTVAHQMRAIVGGGGAQLLVSSHSAAFIGAFPISEVVVLDLELGVTVQRKRSAALTQRRIHALMARFGLRPIEALLSRAVVLVEGGTDVSIVRAVSRWALGFTPEQRDVLVVPCGGKALIFDLYEALIALGVFPYVILDRDASLGGSPAYFAARPASPAALAQMVAAATLLESSIVSGKLKKSLQSVRNELNNGPPPPQAFNGSPLDKLARASGKMSAAGLAQASSAISAGKRKKWQVALSVARIWVWSSDPEKILAAIPGAVGVAAPIAQSAGTTASVLPAGASISQLENWLHGLASEPQLHESVVEGLLAMPRRRVGEIWEFASFLKSVHA